MVERDSEDDFISLYLDYTSETECPVFFHRWTAMTCLSAYLGRKVFFRHGHFTIYPNLYCMLIGSPGTKKSSAIKIGAKLLKTAGYNTFAAKKTRQEKFLLDMAEQSEAEDHKLNGADYSILDQNLWGEDTGDKAEHYINKPPAETFVAADEFNNFIGHGNIDFISILGELWDYEGVYDYRLKNSKSVFIPNPTVSILGGNTPTGFASAFPTDVIGQGFFSRLLLIYGEPSGIKHTFPPVPDIEIQNRLILFLERVREQYTGVEMKMSPEAMKLLDKIYKGWPGLDDLRFEHYANRRLTHLIKLCIVCTASRLGDIIEEEDIIYANTMLSFTEQLMPKALGEFGRAKHSDVTHKLMDAIDKTVLPITLQDLWKVVHQDLETRNQLIELLSGLQMAEKIQAVGNGWLPNKKIIEESVAGAINWNLLTPQEKQLTGALHDE